MWCEGSGALAVEAEVGRGQGRGGYQSHHCLLQTSNRGPPSIRQAQSSYLPGPSGKPGTLEEKYLICPLYKDQQSHKRQEHSGWGQLGVGVGGRKREGGRGSERAIIRERRDKTKKLHLTSPSELLPQLRHAVLLPCFTLPI